MPLRWVFWGFAALIGASLLWRCGSSPALRELLQPPPPAKPIVFDNGTVRQYAPPAPAAGPAALPQGTLRKCWRGSEVSYTNLACPPGFREKAVTEQPVTVLPAVVAPRPAGGAASSPRRLPHVRELLDAEPDPRLRERMMERAIDPGAAPSR